MSLTERIYGKETAGKPAVSSDTQKNLYTAAANKKPSLANRIAQNGGQPTLYADAAAKQKPSLASRIEANGGTPYADAAAQMKSGNAAKGTSVVFNSVYGKADDRASSAGSGKYADILKASDYTELSKSGESKRKLFGDARYDYINNIGNFRAQSDVQQAQGRGQDYGKYAFMTDDEIGVYNYLYAKQGKTAANAYLSDLEPELDKQWYTGTNRATTEALGKNAATRTLASAMTVAAQPTRTITSMIAMADDAVRTAKGQEINPYSKWRQASNITQDLRADTSQHIEETNPGMGGKVGSFVYNTAMSAADSAMNALVAKGIGEAVGLTGDTLMKATNILGSALMSSEASSLSIAESKEKGYSNAGALALGLTRGAIEYASEAVGGEWVIRKIKANPLSFVKSMALTMIPEGMEEVMSDAANGVVNLAIDAAFGTEESGIPKMLEYYRTSGTDWQKKHAELATVLAVLGQEGLSFLGGALATLGSSSVQYSTNRANINQTAERLDTTPKNVVQMMQDAQTENPGVIYALAELTDAENADDLRQKIGTKEDMKRAAEYLTQQMEAGGRSGAQEGTYTAGAQKAPVGTQRAQNEGNSTTPAAAINIQEGMNNGQSTYQGRENGSYDLRTGGQAAAEGGAQALAGGRAEIPGGVGADAQADLRQVTPAQLGIRNGGTEAVTVVDARKLGGDAARAYNLLAANNIEPVAVRGAIQVNNGYANAYTESGRVFFRVDAVDSRGNAISPEALVRHELLHNYISEEVLQASDEVIRESMTAEEYDAMYESYRDAYASIYDFENMSVDEIERLLTEEIAADAYAGLNWFSGDAPVQKAVRAETERNAPARRAEAQQETTGPPGRATAAGIGARTADSAALRRAEALEKSGTDNETIRKETGWYRGMDGQWRFEIDDSGMEFRRDGDAQLMKEEGYRRLNELTDRWEKSFEKGTELSEAETQEMERLQEEYKDAVWGEKYLLRDFVKHDALFEAYPALNRVSLVFDTLPGGTKGYFSKRDNTIVLSDSLFGKEADVVLHEIQHVIQKTEGFTGGASPEYWNERMENGFSKRWTSGEEMMPSELYRNTAGEIEARDTAARRRMSAEERKNTPPKLGDADTVFADGNATSYSIDANFGKNVDDWVKNTPEGMLSTSPGYFRVGTTSEALQSIGARTDNIYMRKSKIGIIFEDHPEVTVDVIKKVPDILENPVLIMKSLTRPDSIVLLGEEKAENGNSLMVALELTPKPGGRTEAEFSLVTSAYGRDDENLRNLINNSELLYLDTNKNRANSWLMQLRVQFPSRQPPYGSIGNIAYAEDGVKITGKKLSELGGVIQKASSGKASVEVENRDSNNKKQGRKKLSEAEKYQNTTSKMAENRTVRNVAEYEKQISRMEKRLETGGQATLNEGGGNFYRVNIREENEEYYAYISDGKNVVAKHKSKAKMEAIRWAGDRMRAEIASRILYNPDTKLRGSYQSDLKRAENREYPVFKTESGTEVQTVPFWTWVKDKSGHYGLVVGQDINGAVRAWFPFGGDGTGTVVTAANTTLYAVEGDYESRAWNNEIVADVLADAEETAAARDVRKEGLRKMTEDDQREFARRRKRDDTLSQINRENGRPMPDKGSGQIYRELMSNGESEVVVPLSMDNPKTLSYKVTLESDAINAYHTAKVMHNGHQIYKETGAAKEYVARDAAEFVDTHANRNFSEENFERAKKLEAEKNADEDASIAELFGDSE